MIRVIRGASRSPSNRSILWVLLALLLQCNAPSRVLAQAEAQPIAPSPSTTPPTPPSLVAPESLAQGFILIVQDKAKRATPTSASSPIFLASNHVNWNPGDASMRLEPRSDMRWQIILARPTNPAPLEFKFTRGSWDECEVNADLSDLANRRLEKIDASRLAPGEKPIIELTIERWSDERPSSKRATDVYRSLEVTGTVRRVQIVGGGGGGGGSGGGTGGASRDAATSAARPITSNASPRAFSREALVWLPPGYDHPKNAQRRYPVLYLMDGQNVFEPPHAPNTPDEWHADETATQLINDGLIEPLIIVAIPHAGEHRVREYAPVMLPALAKFMPGGEGGGGGGGGGGDEFVAFLAERVMPRIDRAFRTRPGKQHTVIGGASMGAAIALHASTQRSDLFGGVILESLPTFASPSSQSTSRPAEPDAWTNYLDGISTWPASIWIGMGDAETGPDEESRQANAALVASAKALEDRIVKSASPSHSVVTLSIGQGHQHNEQAWAKRLPEALKFHFPVREPNNR